MLRELTTQVSIILHFFTSMFQKSEGSPSEDLPATKDDIGVGLDNFPPAVNGNVLDHLSYEQPKSFSKGWNSLIQRDGFLQALPRRENPWLTECYFFIENGFWQWSGFDPYWNNSNLGQSLPNNGKWRKLPPLTFLPPNCDPDTDLFKQFLFCAHEGLVCMNFSKAPQGERLIVFNPLTQQWKELPPLLHRRNPVLMHMYVDQSSKSYHILAAGSSASGDESLSRITEFYDSRTGQWERAGDLPGPAFALNEYQSGVYRNGNIFCIGFLELGDQTVKGILGYNVEEGLWSTKWTAEALPNSPILQLVEMHDDLFLFSERVNGPVTEHWVDRIEWTESEGDEEEKTGTFTLRNVVTMVRSGGRSLQVYPEYACVPYREWHLTYNIEALPAVREGFRVLIGTPRRMSLDHSPRSNFRGFPASHDTTRARMSSAPRWKRSSLPRGRSFGCSALLAFLFLNCLSIAGATPTSAPGPSSSSSQSSTSTYPTVWYVGIGATIVATAVGVIALGVKLYSHMRARGSDSVRGVVDVLTDTFLKCPRGGSVFVGMVRVGEDSVNDLRLKSSPGSSRESSRGSSPEPFPV